MRKHKIIVMTYILFIAVIFGIGSFILIKEVGRSSLSEEQKSSISEKQAYKGIRFSDTWHPNNHKKINTIAKREIYKKEPKDPGNAPKISIPSVSFSNGKEPVEISTSNSVFTGDHQPNEEEMKKLMEEEEKRCLAIMHEHGWYKPEDVPITYGEPQGTSPSVGAYLWNEIKGSVNPPKTPPEVQARNREIYEAVKAALASGNAREAIRIGRELEELNRPYQRLSVIVKMHLERIPNSWGSYFADLANAEQQRLFEAESNRQQ